jgi:hypothetical protein
LALLRPEDERELSFGFVHLAPARDAKLRIVGKSFIGSVNIGSNGVGLQEGITRLGNSVLRSLITIPGMLLLGWGAC